jgi:hypothetical protein
MSTFIWSVGARPDSAGLTDFRKNRHISLGLVHLGSSSRSTSPLITQSIERLPTRVVSKYAPSSAIQAISEGYRPWLSHAHDPKVAGSNPAPATMNDERLAASRLLTSFVYPGVTQGVALRRLGTSEPGLFRSLLYGLRFSRASESSSLTWFRSLSRGQTACHSSTGEC